MGCHHCAGLQWGGWIKHWGPEGSVSVYSGETRMGKTGRKEDLRWRKERKSIFPQLYPFKDFPPFMFGGTLVSVIVSQKRRVPGQILWDNGH